VYIPTFSEAAAVFWWTTHWKQGG